MSQESKDISLLTIILDTNPSQGIFKKCPQMWTQCVESTIAFGNAHLMQKAQNKLAVLACHSTSTEFLFPNPRNQLDIRQVDGQYEVFTMVEKTVKQKLAEILLNEKTSNHSQESLLAGAMSMALCYIARVQRSLVPGTRMNSRILIITGSSHYLASQYMTYMNVFFTAHKLNVILDVCSLDSTTTLSLLQQGTDITGGQYLTLPQTHYEGLLQYLLWVFLPEQPVRCKLVLPPPVKIDYRAACFCHRELIDIGFVCSVCLSIFCKFSPICTTCQTVFKIPAPIGGKPKKKKK
ncbi:general transcription factor IIH subunit 3-like [Ctenocephalides felis]|uniref:general transcription factor IIH subunit 3-like n=1 Tax=Ctenocephalides felis TaxID=7515 RepID=UPI000E6E3E67|nr:general transcription factor IIH subunit 3-like isoform X2 [Ctenocephalides felis]XP_026474296.1 general transcription factor IIH subunit 3-like [Ctenocephalides felis]